jgi:hypothetical protein
VRGCENNYQEELAAVKDANYKLDKELDKYRRNNGLLLDEIEQLKAENAAQLKTTNDYRHKLIQFNSVQNEYDSLVKEYERVVESFHKLEANN